MKLKELIPIIADDCYMSIYYNGKRFYAERALEYKPYTITTKFMGNKYIDDLTVDFITGDEFDGDGEILIELRQEKQNYDISN